MKSLLKKIIILTITSFSVLSGCEKKEVVPLSTFDIVNYEDVKTITDTAELDAYEHTRTPDMVANGIIISPYHTIKVNDLDVPLYASRVSLGVHSFVYLNVNEDKVNLNIEITSTVKTFKKAVVLPLTSGIKATTNENITTANINDFGSFSFAFNGKSDYAVTVMVAKKEVFELPEGYKLKEISPKEKVDGVYPKFDANECCFNEQFTAYYFKKGRYKIRSIVAPNNSVIYFEPGVYLEDYLLGNTLEEQKTDYTPLIYVGVGKNVKIYGNALMDFASHWGGGAGYRSKGHFDAVGITKLSVSGLISINASSWQMCFTNSNYVTVSNCMIFGYRECSDGIMLADCKHSLVHHNFVRTGDDAIEAKSTGSQGGEDLIYEYNAVWADGCRSYGVIYECNKDAHNIIFRHNSVGFAQGAWSDDIGTLAVVMGNNKNATWYDIHFEDIEIYSIKSHVMNMAIRHGNNFGWKVEDNHGGQAHHIYYKDIRVYNRFLSHEELLYIRVEEECSLKNVFIENVQYLNGKEKMAKFKTEDLDNAVMTKCWTWNGVKASQIVKVS